MFLHTSWGLWYMSNLLFHIFFPSGWWTLHTRHINASCITVTQDVSTDKRCQIKRERRKTHRWRNQNKCWNCSGWLSQRCAFYLLPCKDTKPTIKLRRSQLFKSRNTYRSRRKPWSQLSHRTTTSNHFEIDPKYADDVTWVSTAIHRINHIKATVPSTPQKRNLKVNETKLKNSKYDETKRMKNGNPANSWEAC